MHPNRHTFFMVTDPDGKWHRKEFHQNRREVAFTPVSSLIFSLSYDECYPDKWQPYDDRVTDFVHQVDTSR